MIDNRTVGGMGFRIFLVSNALLTCKLIVALIPYTEVFLIAIQWRSV